jgi:hypothetical protein
MLPLDVAGRWLLRMCGLEPEVGGLALFEKSFNASMDRAFLDRYNGPPSFPTLLCAAWLSGEDIDIDMGLRAAVPDSLSLLPPWSLEAFCPALGFTPSLPLVSFPNRANTFLKPFVYLNENVLLRFDRVEDALSFPNKLFGSVGDICGKEEGGGTICDVLELIPFRYWPWRYPSR